MIRKLVRVGLTTLFLLLLAADFANRQTKADEDDAIQSLETRCGWFSNPTPGNASLYDRESEWVIGVQGDYQAKGDWPSFGSKQWVKTNVHYGYGCACVRLRVDRDLHQVIEIASSKARPLSACRNDRALRRWGCK